MRADTLFLDDAAVESFNPNLYYPSPPPPSGLPSNGDCPGRFTSHRCSARWKPHGNVFKRMSRRREK